MRSITFLVTPPEQFIGHRLFEKSSDIYRERIYHLNVLDNETLILLARLRGDLESAEQILGESSTVLGHSISNENGTEALVYVHVSPPPEIKQLLKLPGEHEVFFDFPIEGTRNGKLRFVMIGETNQIVHRAFEYIPPEVETTVERIGPYPDEGDILSLLTDRQQDVLNKALELGYYDTPRQATHQDIADQMDISVGTVTEHLQKIESRVFGSVVR